MKSKFLESLYQCFLFVKNQEKPDDKVQQIQESLKTIDTNINLNTFISIIQKESKGSVIDQLKMIIDLYAKKRRGEELPESFDDLKENFRDIVSEAIADKYDGLEAEAKKPFASELFENVVEFSKEGVKLKESKQIGDFAYIKQWWKPKYLESRAMEDFILATNFDFDVFVTSDILSESFDRGTMYIKPTKDRIAQVKESVDYLLPYTSLNETGLPSWIKKMDTGKISITESSDLESVIELSSDLIQIRLKATKQFESSDFWEIQKESRHRRDQCMECSDKPKYEVLWAEGKGHAWFCESDLKKWSKEHKDDIDYIKEIKDGVAAIKFSENKNPNIRDSVL